MDVLVIHHDGRSRVHLAKALQGAAHRVTLSSSVAEAEEMLRFARAESAAPSVVLVAEDLLSERSARLRRELSARFDDMMWIPLRHDMEIGWLAGWLTRLELDVPAPRRQVLNVVLVEPNHGMRRAIAGSLTTGGDTVVSCASVAEAREFLDGLGASNDTWVLVAPVMARGSETISLYLAARTRLPNLRWVVLTPDRTPVKLAKKTARRAPPARLADLELVRRDIADHERP